MRLLGLGSVASHFADCQVTGKEVQFAYPRVEDFLSKEICRICLASYAHPVAEMAQAGGDRLVPSTHTPAPHSHAVSGVPLSFCRLA